MKTIIALIVYTVLSSSFCLSQTSIVLLPNNYNTSKKYPLVLFMPGTDGLGKQYAVYLLAKKEDWNMIARRKMKELSDNGSDPSSLHVTISYTDFTEADLKSMYLKRMQETKAPEFIMAFLPGRISAAQYASGEKFAKLIERVSKETATEVDALEKKYSIDSRKVVWSGFSVGGDLSFAVPAFNPQRYYGALVIASKCTYRGKTCFDTLAARNFRYSFLIGDRDPRRASMNSAITLLKQKKVQTSFATYSGAHDIPTIEAYISSLLPVFGK